MKSLRLKPIAIKIKELTIFKKEMVIKVSEKIISNEGMILIVRSNDRQTMVEKITCYPSSKPPKQIALNKIVLLYNSAQDYFFAKAKYIGTLELTKLEKNLLRTCYPNAFDPNWKSNVLLDEFAVISNKFTLGNLNNFSKKVTKKYGYTLDKKGNIMYIDSQDMPIFKKRFNL